MIDAKKVEQIRDQIKQARTECYSDTGNLNWKGSEILVQMGLLKEASDNILDDPAYEWQTLDFTIKVLDKIIALSTQHKSEEAKL